MRIFLWPFRVLGWVIQGLAQRVGMFFALLIIGLPIGSILPFSWAAGENSVMEYFQSWFSNDETTDAVVRIAGFQPLHQHDSVIYQPSDFAHRNDPTQPGKTIGDIACLATVYLMIERVHKNPSARITPEWFDAQANVFRRSGVHPEEAFEVEKVVMELDQERPVILRGRGSSGGPAHYFLAIGYIRSQGVVEKLIALDPWVGREVELEMIDGQFYLPRWPGHRITNLRRTS